MFTSSPHLTLSVYFRALHIPCYLRQSTANDLPLSSNWASMRQYAALYFPLIWTFPHHPVHRILTWTPPPNFQSLHIRRSCSTFCRRMVVLMWLMSRDFALLANWRWYRLDSALRWNLFIVSEPGLSLFKCRYLVAEALTLICESISLFTDRKHGCILHLEPFIVFRDEFNFTLEVVENSFVPILHYLIILCSQRLV